MSNLVAVYVAILAACAIIAGCGGGIAIPPELVDALTNRPPIQTTTTTTQPPIATNPALQPTNIATVAIGCKCDLSKPVSKPPYTGDWLASQGNREECPNTKAGAGVVRLAIKDTGWLIGHLLNQGYDIDGNGNACGKCFAADGGTYHFLGWNRGDPKEELIVYTAPGVWFPYQWVTFIWFEYRKAQ